MAPQTQSADDALRHTGVAMAQLRRALSDPNLLTHDYTISSVLFLVLLSVGSRSSVCPCLADVMSIRLTSLFRKRMETWPGTKCIGEI